MLLGNIAVAQLMRKKNNVVRPMLIGFLLYIASWLALMVFAWGIDGWQPRAWVAGISTAGFCFLGYIELLSHVCRGFSMRIVIDVYQRKNPSFEDILQSYAGGLGMDWFLQKRINAMRDTGTVEYDGDYLWLTPKGIFVGRMGYWVKRILNIGLGG
jgi:hypothetical protein